MNPTNRRPQVSATVLALSAVLALLPTGPSPYDACRLLNAKDVAPLLGDAATSELTQGGQNCTWHSADGHQKLFVKTPESTRTKPEVTFDRYRTGPHTSYTLADEPGMGDKAVSALTPWGIEFMVLKHDGLLQLQYWGGGRGTAEMLAKARPIAKKAADAF